MKVDVVEITRDEAGNLKEIFRDSEMEMRYPLVSGTSTSSKVLYQRPELCFAFTLNSQPDVDWVNVTGSMERLDFWIR